MIQQPGAEDGDGDSVSDATDETAGFDLADAASGTEDAGDAVEDAGASDSSLADAKTASAWTLLVATLFLAGL